MPDIIIEQLCFLLELICYLTLISSLSGIPIKKMRHPFIALSSNFFICSVLSYIFSNALGWIILCLCCFITFSYILHVSFFKSSIAYVLSYALLSLIQDIVVMALFFVRTYLLSYSYILSLRYTNKENASSLYCSIQ